MKLKLSKGAVTAFLAGVMFTAALPIMAGGVSQKIDVIVGGIKIYADEELVDTNGENQPFIYNGTTYLPVRAVGEAFDKAVKWDPKTSSVYLGRIPDDTTTPTKYIADMDYLYKNRNFDFGAADDNLGKTHEKCISTSYYNGSEIEYLLNGQYKRLKGIVFLEYDARSYNGGTYSIYGDEQLLYTTNKMPKGTLPQDFDIDITGVLRLKIVANEGENAARYVSLGELALY